MMSLTRVLPLFSQKHAYNTNMGFGINKQQTNSKQTANTQQHTDYEVEMVPSQTCTTIILYTFTSKAAMTVNYMDLSKYLNRGKCSQDDQSPIHFKIISKQSLYWDQKQQ